MVTVGPVSRLASCEDCSREFEKVDWGFRIGRESHIDEPLRKVGRNRNALREQGPHGYVPMPLRIRVRAHRGEEGERYRSWR